MREPRQTVLIALSMVYPSSKALRMRSGRLLYNFLKMLFGRGSRKGPYQRRKGPYQTKDGAWYFKDLRVAKKGPEDFVPLLGPFAKSPVAGYYRGRAVPDSDGPSFAALSDHYAKDKRDVFYCDTYRSGREYYMILHDRTFVIESADPATFQYLTGGYARDASRVYFKGLTFRVKDVASFTVLEYGFAKDQFTGYYDREPIAGSDGPTFTGIDSHYSKDKDRVFYSGLVYRDSGIADVKTIALAGAQPAGFVALGSGYAKDGDIVFYDGQPVHGANAATFRVQFGLPGGADARDDRTTYAKGWEVKVPK